MKSTIFHFRSNGTTALWCLKFKGFKAPHYMYVACFGLSTDSRKGLGAFISFLFLSRSKIYWFKHGFWSRVPFNQALAARDGRAFPAHGVLVDLLRWGFQYMGGRQYRSQHMFPNRDPFLETAILGLVFQLYRPEKSLNSPAMSCIT